MIVQTYTTMEWLKQIVSWKWSASQNKNAYRLLTSRIKKKKDFGVRKVKIETEIRK